MIFFFNMNTYYLFRITHNCKVRIMCNDNYLSIFFCFLYILNYDVINALFVKIFFGLIYY